MLDIILIAMLAGFIALRLRSELGKKTGNEPLPPAAGRAPGTEPAAGHRPRRMAAWSTRRHGAPQPGRGRVRYSAEGLAGLHGFPGGRVHLPDEQCRGACPALCGARQKSMAVRGFRLGR